MRPPMVYIVWLNGKGWSRNFTSFYPSHGMFRVASQAEAKWLLYKIQQGRTFSSMPKPIGWAAGRHLGPGLNSLKDVVNQDLPFIFLRCLSIWAAATTKCTKILGNWGPKVRSTFKITILRNQHGISPLSSQNDQSSYWMNVWGKLFAMQISHLLHWL